MSTAAEYYCRALHKHFSLLGTWLPNARMSLGDVGILDRGIFQRFTSLGKLGANMRIRKGLTPAVFSFSSEMTAAVRSSASGSIVPGHPLGRAQVDLKFASQGGFMFQAIDCYRDEIDDKAGLAKVILGYVRTGEWRGDWAVVDSVVRAGSATIIIANSSQASLGLHVDGPAEFSSLAKLTSGFEVNSESGNIARFISQGNLVPLFTLGRIKTSFIQQALGLSGHTVHFGGAGSVLLTQGDNDFFEAVIPD
jgi:hypothetical protein